MFGMHIRTIRKAHRYLGLIVGIQLFLWTASGLVFSLNPIDKVRGSTEAAPPAAVEEPASGLISPSIALAELEKAHPGLQVSSVELAPLLDRAVYRITAGEGTFLADAATGTLLPQLDRNQAVAVAEADFTIDATVAAVELIREAPPGSEYRSSPLPVWRVTFDHPLGTRIYVAADSGLVVKRRNNRWRLFDFFWMLHILDLDHRDDFNNRLLQVAAALALVTVLSGFLLGARTSPLLRRRGGG